jgi:hypothetical protein
MDAEAKKEIDALKSQLATQAKLIEGFAAIAGMQDEGKRAAAEEVARKKRLVADIKAKAIELSGEAKPEVLKYVVGEVMHYRRGVQYKTGEIIALPNDEKPENQPSFTWRAHDPKAARGEDPVAAAERKALSQLAKEQATKATGPLAPKKAARPSDTEV